MSEILKPFTWLALAAFLVGFVGALALGDAVLAKPHARFEAASAPAPGDRNPHRAV